MTKPWLRECEYHEVQRKQTAKLRAWLAWCVECNGEAEYYFGTAATKAIADLLAGGDAPMPPRI